MKIAFVHYPGRLSRLDAARAGGAPTEFLFGAIELESSGHRILQYEVDPDLPGSRIGRRVVDVGAGAGYLPPHLAAVVLESTHKLLPALRAADAVVATTTGTAMALATWSRLGLLRRPLVGIVAGLLNHPWRRTRTLTTLPLLRRMQVVLYGPGELDGMRALEIGDRVHVVPFGVDAGFWAPGEIASRREVLAIGNDGHRDWTTLVAAAPYIPAPVRILTRHPRPDHLPPNVSWERADWYTQILSDEDVRDLYRQAAVVVVPTKDVPQPSGQSVTLQAMACGKPVVLSKTRGLFAPAMLRDGENVVLTPPGDPAELAGSIRGVLDDPTRAARIGRAGREAVLADAGVDAYAARLLEVCRSAMAHP
jgi:glycosyltransferase involved in cell wall biosynthesis